MAWLLQIFTELPLTRGSSITRKWLRGGQKPPVACENRLKEQFRTIYKQTWKIDWLSLHLTDYRKYMLAYLHSGAFIARPSLCHPLPLQPVKISLFEICGAHHKSSCSDKISTLVLETVLESELKWNCLIRRNIKSIQLFWSVWKNPKVNNY